MIKKCEAEEILNGKYTRKNFLKIVRNLAPDFVEDKCFPDYNKEIFASVEQLGKSESCEINVYEVKLKKDTENRRVAITREMYKVIRGQLASNALISFVNSDEKNFRISLLVSEYKIENDKPQKGSSNPRRYSFSLGDGVKTKTAYDFLVAPGSTASLNELTERFSVEVVNKLFYKEIAKFFTQLVGGETFDGQKYDRILEIDDVTDSNKYVEFSVRLIGRIIFCWFLKEKKSEKNKKSLLPDKIFSEDCVIDHRDYYCEVLEPLFYEVLNTPVNSRTECVKSSGMFGDVPYLNGGLFSPHEDDHYIQPQSGDSSGSVHIPNEWFSSFFNILGQYNFTIDENTAYDVELSIDPEMLGRIFENLLAEINPETGESARKNTGSFYTPRDIVDFMVDSSLRRYLMSTTGLDESRIESILSYNGSDVEFDENEKGKIIDALYDITVLDPACGSGAFPIGMMQKIVYVLQIVDPGADLWFKKSLKGVDTLLRDELYARYRDKSYDYIRKLTVIRRSIFGVDIQPIAVEIARLRCFLSLIIEEKVIDEDPNRGIKPLPNLEFKFVIANTLLKLNEGPSTNNYQASMLVNDTHMEELTKIREAYFNLNDAEKKKEKQHEFEKLQNEMRSEYEADTARRNPNYVERIVNTKKSKKNGKKEMRQDTQKALSKYKQLCEWNPFSNSPSEWFDSKWMFGIDGGFDVVIGNPPYINFQDDGRLSKIYENCGYESFHKRGDIYCLFYERGIQLIKNGGILIYITSNSWMCDDYGTKLWPILANQNPVLLVDFPNQKIFDAATVNVNILLLAKGKYENSTMSCIATKECKSNLSAFVRTHVRKCEFSAVEKWVIISDDIEYSIKDKIERYGSSLVDFDITINRGITTGCNPVFVIKGSQKNTLIATEEKSAEIICPILLGENIGRFKSEFGDWWLINVHNGYRSQNSQERIPPVDINKYKAIKEYLDANWDKFESRTDQGIDPYHLRDCAFLESFSKPKMICKRVGSKLRFSYDEKGYLGLDSTCFAVGEHVKYLTAVFNTHIGNYLFKDSPKTGTGDLLVSVKAFKPIRVPYPTEDMEKQITNLFDEIVQTEDDSERNKLEDTLEKIVSDLYHFEQLELEYIISATQKYR